LKYLAQTQRYLELKVEINYSDEELAMLPFYMLFRYERDERMLGAYRNALGQWWQNIERERSAVDVDLRDVEARKGARSRWGSLDDAADTDGSGGVVGGQFDAGGREARRRAGSVQAGAEHDAAAADERP